MVEVAVVHAPATSCVRAAVQSFVLRCPWAVLAPACKLGNMLLVALVRNRHMSLQRVVAALCGRDQ
jgi:hypothetical protein